MSLSRCYLLLNRIEIANANAISSPITYGFPSITGFLGAIHALSRKLPPEWELTMGGVLVACHHCDIQAYRPHSFADYSFNQSRNPIKRNGKTASIIEEGKVHLTITLLVEVNASRQGRRWLDNHKDEFTRFIQQTLMQQRIAGGSVNNIQHTRLFNWNEDPNVIRQRLLPAFVLMEARQDMVEITEELQQTCLEANGLDALIETATLHHIPDRTSETKTGYNVTCTVKQGRGWLVPIPVGFQAIHSPFEPGELENCRTRNYPVQYVESVYSLGRWVFPLRIEDLSSALWRYHHDDTFYLATQTFNSI